MSNVDLSSSEVSAAEAKEGISGNLNDQEFTDSVMLEIEPRPPPILLTTSAALSDDEDAETAEGGRKFLSPLHWSNVS